MTVVDNDFLSAVAPRMADGSLSGFLAQLERVAGCSRPIRLAGAVDQVDKLTGELRRVVDTATMPDGTLLVPCGNRRASVCPSCSYLYAGDAWQIVHGGLTGSELVPASVASHPGLFVTVTAPSFGPVHSTRANHGPPRKCRPRRGRCPHGRANGCHTIHSKDDPRLGVPLCLDCHDNSGLVVWNRTAGRLWKRTVDATYRQMAQRAGMSERRLRSQVRISYVKVAEAQARGAVHFHAVLRLDDASVGHGEWAPPPTWATSKLLAACWRWAVSHVAEPCPDPHRFDLPTEADAVAALVGGGLLDTASGVVSTRAPMVSARWGEQVDVRRLEVDGGDLTPLAVGNYLAKYVTKSVSDSGALDRRIRDAEDLYARTPFLPAHTAELVKSAWRLAARPEFADLGMRRWAHQLGFNGHWVTKSRSYSTTFTARRTARRTWRKTHSPLGEERPALDAWGRDETEDLTENVASWRFHSVGYRTDGDRWLALQAADLARSRRESVRSDSVDIAA